MASKRPLPTGCPCGVTIEKLVILQALDNRVTSYYRVCVGCGLRIANSLGRQVDVLEALQHAFDKRMHWPQESLRHDVLRQMKNAYIAATGDTGDDDERK